MSDQPTIIVVPAESAAAITELAPLPLAVLEWLAGTILPRTEHAWTLPEEELGAVIRRVLRENPPPTT